MLGVGEGLFVAAGKTASLSAGSGTPSILLYFLLAPAADQPQTPHRKRRVLFNRKLRPFTALHEDWLFKACEIAQILAHGLWAAA